jgi:hypothetical protein
MTTVSIPSLFDALSHLLAVLVAEETALRSLDLVGIDEATTAKLEIEPILAAALSQSLPTGDAERGALKRLRDEVVRRARANHRRMRASLVVVSDLVDQLTGVTRATYGRDRDTPVRAVLTQTIG